MLEQLDHRPAQIIRLIGINPSLSTDDCLLAQLKLQGEINYTALDFWSQILVLGERIF